LFDAAFWGQNGAALSDRFAGWVDGKLDINGNPVVTPPQPETPEPEKGKPKGREPRERPRYERGPRHDQNFNP
jgi:hypothetical protein